jgi:hypothetical protein
MHDGGRGQMNDGNTGDVEAAVRADEPTVCAHCGQRIDIKKWHPLVTGTDEHGEFQVYAFCSEACRDSWLDDTTATEEES